MKKLAHLLYDVTDFVSEGKIDYLVKLTKSDPEDLIKEAHVPSQEEVVDMSDSDFAVILYHPSTGFMKKYAMTDKATTKLNVQIFEDNMHKYPDEIVKTASHYFTKAAKHFNMAISPELKKLGEGKHITNIVDLTELNEKAFLTKQSSMTKIANTPRRYALPDRKKYPLDTPEMISKAVEYFEKHAEKFSPTEAMEYAINVLKAKAPIEGTKIEKYANLTDSKFNQDYENLIGVRKRFVTEEKREVYDELIEKSAEFGVIKTAEYLEEIDTKLGVNRQWNRGVEDPYISVLGLKKEASCSYKGKKIKHGAIIKAARNIVDEATLKDLSGPEGIAVFESLPDPIKLKICNAAA